MDFMTAVKTVLFERYADFKGRSPRAEYWWFFVFNIIVSVVVQMLAGLGAVIAIIGMLISLAVLIPGIAVGVRRLHDLGKSGWWLLIAFVPIVGTILLIYWFAQEGEQTPNQWGPPPYGGDLSGTFE